MNILLVSGHSGLKNNSVANRTIIEEFHRLMPEAELSLLDELYPDFIINVEAEQQKLIKADVIILQFPVWWYSQPALLHKWMEDTFQHGFSHGTTGKALAGKKLIASFTAGAPAEAYTKEVMGYSVEEFVMPPVAATAFLTGMQLLEPVYTLGVSYQSRNNSEALAEMENRAKEHAQKLVETINSITKEELWKQLN